MNREGEIGLAKDIIDWLFVKHDHIGFGVVLPEGMVDTLEKIYPRPVVDSLDLEKYIKDRYPELKDYHWGKE
jgi:hypothetical protein